MICQLYVSEDSNGSDRRLWSGSENLNIGIVQLYGGEKDSPNTGRR